jgi:hypothetical protein
MTETKSTRWKEKRMTFAEFKSIRKRATAAELKRAGVTPNEQTQYGWVYPGGLVIESTEGWDHEWAGMYYLLVEGREYVTDDLDKLELIMYERYSGGHAASTTNADP